MAPATPVFAGEPAPTEGGVAFNACAASVVYRCAPHLSGNWRDPLWERACPRSRRRDGWHRLRRCSRVNPLPQSGVAFKACAASVVYRCAPTFPETGAIHCESGHAREAGDVMDGTGYAGVRGRARSHRGWCGLQCMCCLSGISVCPPPFRKLARSPVRAGMPAKQATRWMAPATPVFAGAPAPTWAVLASRQVMSMRGGQWSGPCSHYLHDPLVKWPCVAKSLLSTGRYLASKQAASQ